MTYSTIYHFVILFILIVACISYVAGFKGFSFSIFSTLISWFVFSTIFGLVVFPTPTVSLESALRDSIKRNGDKVSVSISPSHFLTQIDGRNPADIIHNRSDFIAPLSFPLSGAPSTFTIYCNEENGWIKYPSDRFGFNNGDAIWNSSIQLAIIGDSYAQGACVQMPLQRDLTAQGVNTVSVGMGGSGPLIEFASLVELLRHVRPPNLVWLISLNDFARGSDSTLEIDLLRELEEPELMKYLNSGYSQNYFSQIGSTKYSDRAIDLTRNWLSRSSYWNSFLDSIGRYTGFDAARFGLRLLSARMSSTNLTFRELDRKNIEILTNIYARGADLARDSGSRLTFVVLPELYHCGHHFETVDALVSWSAASNINLLNFSTLWCDHRNFFTKMPGHYSNEGYKEMARLIRANVLK